MKIRDSEFRTDGGATWLNMLATQGQSFGAEPIERLTDSAALTRWVTLMGLGEMTLAVQSSDVDDAHKLRESMRALAMATVAGTAPPRSAQAHVEVISKSTPRDSAIRIAFAMIATQSLVTLAGPDAAYLRECDERDCRWVFLDTSGRRRWCPAPACANRGRVREHRARATPTF